jgi:nicotinic acid mononucleotide adenylyltransferase
MKTILIAGIIIIGVFLFVLAFIPLGIEPLTEVYFENHTQLPVYLFLDKPYNYSFTVHNLEYQKMRYTYTVDTFDENGKLLYNMDKGEFILGMDEKSVIEESFKLAEHFNRTEIVVNVSKDLSLERPKFKNKLWWPDPNYPMSIDIHFWIEEVEGTQIIITKD